MVFAAIEMYDTAQIFLNTTLKKIAWKSLSYRRYCIYNVVNIVRIGSHEAWCHRKTEGRKF